MASIQSTPVEVRRGQVWEFGIDGGPVRRARVERITVPIWGVRYVFLKRVADGRSMRVTLRRLQHREEGARLVEDASIERVEMKARSVAEVVERPPQSRIVHEPRISVSDRRRAVARAHLLHGSGMAVAQIAKALCVMPAVVEVWLAEKPTEGP